MRESAPFRASLENFADYKSFLADNVHAQGLIEGPFHASHDFDAGSAGIGGRDSGLSWGVRPSLGLLRPCILRGQPSADRSGRSRRIDPLAAGLLPGVAGGRPGARRGRADAGPSARARRRILAAGPVRAGLRTDSRAVKTPRHREDRSHAKARRREEKKRGGRRRGRANQRDVFNVKDARDLNAAHDLFRLLILPSVMHEA